MKFKRGDKLTVIDNSTRHGFEIGSAVKVKKVHEEDRRYSVEDENSQVFYLREEELKKRK